MDTTVAGIGSLVVAELRAAGYLESTIGQYSRTIRVLARFAAGVGQRLQPGTGRGVRVEDCQPAHGPVQRAAADGLRALLHPRVRLLRSHGGG